MLPRTKMTHDCLEGWSQGDRRRQISHIEKKGESSRTHKATTAAMWGLVESQPHIRPHLPATLSHGTVTENSGHVKKAESKVEVRKDSPQNVQSRNLQQAGSGTTNKHENPHWLVWDLHGSIWNHRLLRAKVKAEKRTVLPGRAAGAKQLLVKVCN